MLPSKHHRGSGGGHEGIQAVFTERQKVGGDMAFMAFDILDLEARRVLREPWRDRRKRLEDLFRRRDAAVPMIDDAPGLYDAWTAMGGEGIVLKDRGSPLSAWRAVARVAQVETRMRARPRTPRKLRAPERRW